MKKLLRKLFLWLFADEFKELKENLDYIKEVVGDKVSSCSVDYHPASGSWAVIHLHSKNKTYLKFLRLKNGDCIDIINFLKAFDYADIDAAPATTKFIECELNKL